MDGSETYHTKHTFSNIFIAFPGYSEMFKSFAILVLVVNSDEVNSIVQVLPQSGAC